VFSPYLQSVFSRIEVGNWIKQCQIKDIWNKEQGLFLSDCPTAFQLKKSEIQYPKSEIKKSFSHLKSLLSGKSYKHRKNRLTIELGEF